MPIRAVPLNFGPGPRALEDAAPLGRLVARRAPDQLAVVGVPSLRVRPPLSMNSAGVTLPKLSPFFSILCSCIWFQLAGVVPEPLGGHCARSILAWRTASAAPAG